MTEIVLALIAAGVLCTTVMVLVMLGSDLAARRAKRAEPDPVEQAYADTGLALGDDAEQYRMTALGELIDVERLCIEIDTAIRQHRNGKDITSGALKEQA